MSSRLVNRSTTCSTVGKAHAVCGCPLATNALRICCLRDAGRLPGPAGQARKAEPTGIAVGKSIDGGAVGALTPVAAPSPVPVGDSFGSGRWSMGPEVARAIPMLGLIR